MPRADTDTTKGGGLRTTVPVVPDAPIGHFRLTVFGGKRGYLVNTRDLCARPAVTHVKFTGQNGKLKKQRVPIKAPCGASSARRHRGAH